MTQAVKGKTQAEFAQFFEEFHNIVTGQTPVGDPTTVGKLAVFAGVSAYPVRVKCASLAWHTLRAALAGEDQPVSTE
jgi:nitrogen fixation NifU-like protein